jgi:hypothetical protein
LKLVSDGEVGPDFRRNQTKGFSLQIKFG